MVKRFNTTGNCIPHKHYMVDISEKLKEIKQLVDDEAYFTINRGRQYGKTTTLSALVTYLADEYTVISLSFEALGGASFVDENIFCRQFLTLVQDKLNEKQTEVVVDNFLELNQQLTQLCKNKKIVLMIDEVDKASNYQVFLGFLNLLRSKFIDRANDYGATFHSVILAGVYDIKNIKFKMVQDRHHRLIGDEAEQNSPWNIAEKFKVDMSFSITEISSMLKAYEFDQQTDMDISAIATRIHYYTNGYPVLVSGLCRYIDEELEKKWTTSSVDKATRLLVRETDNELFKSLSQNLEKNEKVRKLLYDVLIIGSRRSFSAMNPTVNLAYRYGYIYAFNDQVKIFNKIFEMITTSYFVTKDEEERQNVSMSGMINEITQGNQFNMSLCLERFMLHWQEIYNEKDAQFLEKQCRLIFLTYLKPILNGVGFYFIESALTDDRRMDLVVIYNQQRFVLELKIWKGLLYNEQGVEQLLGYMDKLNEDKGYLLTFDFRANPSIIPPTWRDELGKKVFEVRV